MDRHGIPELFLTTPSYLILLSENCCFTGSTVAPLSHEHIFLMTVIFLLRFQEWLEAEATSIEW